MTAREQAADVDVAALVEVARERGVVSLTPWEMAAVARKVSDAWADADLARESEKGWRRESDELAEKVARVEALADEWEREYQSPIDRPWIVDLRAALGGES